mgnify:CR=1 FL=1
MSNFVIREKCPVCDSTESEILLSKFFSDESIFNFIDNFYNGKIKKNDIKNNKYILSKCKKCSLIFQKEILDNESMNKLYEEFINPEKSLMKRERSDSKYFEALYSDCMTATKICERKFNLIPKKLNFLDFGMGWGHWLIAAKACGVNGYGSEISEERINFAKKNCVKVIDPFEDIYQEYFHFISTDQVFEHLSDPNKVLGGLVKSLKKGGILKIFIPTTSQAFLRLKILGKKWTPINDAFHPLEHINSFNYKSLCKLTKRHNLYPLKINDAHTNLFLQGKSRLKLALGVNRWYFTKI